MSENSKIEWCDHTFNPWIGCTKVSPGCANCYAETLMDTRYGKVQWGKDKPRARTSAANWKLPLKWNRMAASCGKPEGADECPICSGPNGPHRPRVFCASLADWLDDEVPIEWLADLLALIHATPNLDWLMLTKRPENFKSRLVAAIAGNWADPADLTDRIHAWVDGTRIPHNVWIGTTVENQDMADKRIPDLLRIPARVLFLSCEPLLESIDVSYPEAFYPDGPTRCCDGRECSCMGMPIDPPLVWELNWVICGGESGPNARPMDVEWARSLRDQCKAANTAFFMKQMGGHRKPFMEIPGDLMVREFPKGGVA